MSQYPLNKCVLVVTNSREENVFAATLALIDTLHEPNGQMVIDWKRIYANRERRKTCIVLAYENRKVIGALICYVNSAFTATYVKPEYRGKGIGSTMIRELRKYHNLANRVLVGDAGFEGWESFFARNHIMRERICGSVDEINVWAERNKGSLLTFLNFNKKRHYLAMMRREQSHGSPN